MSKFYKLSLSSALSFFSLSLVLSFFLCSSLFLFLFVPTLVSKNIIFSDHIHEIIKVMKYLISEMDGKRGKKVFNPRRVRGGGPLIMVIEVYIFFLFSTPGG